MKHKVLIIAEAGVNHNGNLEQARKLIKVAAECGVDYVKFQTFKAAEMVTRNAGRAAYQEKNTGNRDSQLEMLRKLELSEADHQDLVAYSREMKIGFLSTGFDLASLDLLKTLSPELAKVPSGEITNLPYLRKISRLFPRVILSTGMASMDEVKQAFGILVAQGTLPENITVLHCNTEYPTPMKDVNLKAMLHMERELHTQVGYSDHTLGIEVPIAAVALGASVIEKHFTLDRNLPGPDHRASLEPGELRAMVSAIRNIELALSGSGVKEPSASEIKNKLVARKSIVASRAIKQGEMFSEENLTVKRPGTGMSPMEWDIILGKKAEKDFEPDEILI